MTSLLSSSCSRHSARFCAPWSRSPWSTPWVHPMGPPPPQCPSLLALLAVRRRALARQAATFPSRIHLADGASRAGANVACGRERARALALDGALAFRVRACGAWCRGERWSRFPRHESAASAVRPSREPPGGIMKRVAACRTD